MRANWEFNRSQFFYVGFIMEITRFIKSCKKQNYIIDMGYSSNNKKYYIYIEKENMIYTMKFKNLEIANKKYKEFKKTNSISDMLKIEGFIVYRR